MRKPFTGSKRREGTGRRIYKTEKYETESVRVVKRVRKEKKKTSWNETLILTHSDCRVPSLFNVFKVLGILVYLCCLIK